MTRPVPGFPEIYTPAAVKRMLHDTACEPFLLQVMCAVLVDTLNARHWTAGDGPIDVEDVTGAADAAVQRAQHNFLNLWQESIPAAARPLIRALAAATRPQAEHSMRPTASSSTRSSAYDDRASSLRHPPAATH